MKEVVLFDKNNKEIDWYDPVEEQPEIKNGYLIINNGYAEYKVPTKSFSRWEWREVQNEV